MLNLVINADQKKNNLFFVKHYPQFLQHDASQDDTNSEQQITYAFSV